MSLTVIGSADEEKVLAPVGGYTAFQIVVAPSGKLGYVNSHVALLEGEPATIITKGRVSITAGSSLTWTKGYPVFVDLNTQEAVQDCEVAANLALAGKAAEDKGSGDTAVEILLNDLAAGPPIQMSYEFDCEGGDTDNHVLIPAQLNKTGLLITRIFGRITEVFGGASQDQGVVTVKDGDGNSLTTITVADAAADAADDYRLGYALSAASAGDAMKKVAAGKAVMGAVSQQTTGASAAGKIRVTVEAVPLV